MCASLLWILVKGSEALLLDKRVEKAFISHFIISFLGLMGSDHNHWVQPQAVQG